MIVIAYAPLQAQGAADQTEPESSSNKTEKSPGLPKVCDIDFLLDTTQHKCLFLMMKPHTIYMIFVVYHLTFHLDAWIFNHKAN